MSAWVRRWRPYLIVAPIVLALGFSFTGYKALTGNDTNPTSPDDVPEGGTGTYQGLSIRLTSLKVQEPEPGAFGSEAHEGAVIVIARFRGRIDDPAKAKKVFCTSTVENADGWEWKSTTLSQPYITTKTSTTCDGKRVDSQFKDVTPPPHQWYEFAYGYYVPKERARGLRPTISYYQEFPRYLRFES